jgi:NAD(P)-dependent dehydrogenase (short-subunit alcohol dehydrogenase family)
LPLTGFVDVLRQELHGTGVRATTIFPGRIDTPMIEGLSVPRISPKAPPELVAVAVLRALRTGAPELYVPELGPRALLWLNTLSPSRGAWGVRFLGLSGRDPQA